MFVTDNTWNQMLETAKSLQQEHHELLPDWTKYERHEYKLLYQNIGFALFGPPTENKDANVVLNGDKICSNSDLVNTFDYSLDAEKMIDIIFKKVCEFGHGCIVKNSLFYGLIYNITFRTKNSPGSKSDSRQNKKEEKDKESEINLMQVPIFKIRTLGKQIWYIDTSGRVYKSWTDYKENNTLPKCTMVLPKNGLYEPDPRKEFSEEYSVVFLDILDSPACHPATTLGKELDVLSNVVGTIGIGMFAASFFTPLAPLAIGAATATRIHGVWSFTRSLFHLADRHCHEESVSITDRSALSSWLTITGCTLGMAASRGNVLLTRAVKSGSNVRTTARVAYNALLLSNVGINSIGIAYQTYCLYEKYNQEGKVGFVDAAFLATHILFLGNAVMNIQFAGELIESTQGKILDDYKATLRSKNMKRKFNRAKSNAAKNNPDKISANAEVIRYINKKVDLEVNITTGNIEKEKCRINDIWLLDPMEFVDILLINSNYSDQRKSERNTDSAASILKDLLLYLLKELFIYDVKSKHVPNVAEFNDTIEDMKNMVDASRLLELVFMVAIRLATGCSSCSEYLAKAFKFVWDYAKECLRRMLLKAYANSAQQKKNLNQIITFIYQYMDEIKLLPAFQKYISKLTENRLA